jgi:large subunit ribosomal protein L16
MANMPKRVKHRKVQRRRLNGFARRGNKVVFGDHGLQALEAGWIPANVIEAARVTANRFLRGEGRIYIRMFPHKPVTCIPQETRMGKGKGEPEYWAAEIRPGKVLYEIGGVPADVAKQAFARISHKLPLKVRYIPRRPI